MEIILPEHFFELRSSFVLILLLAISIALVCKGADWLVGGAVGFSKKAGIPKAIVGATIVSLGTTMPEMAVSVMAAFRGLPDFALGNAVGSIICDTGMIFGIACLLTRLPADRFLLSRHGWVQVGAGVLLIVLSLLFRDDTGQRVLPRFVGFFLLALLAGYLLISYRWARQQGQPPEELEETLEKAPRSAPVALGFLALGVVLVIFGSHVMIQSVRVLAERWGVPPSILAATLIAFGTSLPELVTAIACVIRKQPGLLVGNIIGADILNVLFVTGAAASATPLVVDSLFLTLHFPVMMGVLILFRFSILFAKDGFFPRWPGAVLLGVYLLYLVGVVMVSGGGGGAH